MVSDVHEIFDLEAFFGEEVFCAIFASVGDVEFVLEIEIVRDFAAIHGWL